MATNKLPGATAPAAARNARGARVARLTAASRSSSPAVSRWARGAVLVIDLFSRASSPPRSIEEAAARRWDLIFANQTHHAIEAYEREEHLRRTLLQSIAAGRAAAEATRAGDQSPTRIFRVSYRATADEGGPERQFDFSRHSIAARWSSGERDIGDLVRKESAFARLASMQAHRAGA